MIRLERRLHEPRWLPFAVPLAALVVAFAVGAVILIATGHAPIPTYRRLFDSAFFAEGALTQALVTSTPLVLTGLAAAFAFRMQLFNIGAEGQLYMGAAAAAAVGIALDDRSVLVAVPAMVLAGFAGGLAWALVPAALRAYASTNEIISTLMLNYVALAVLNYLIFDSFSYWRAQATLDERQFPQGKLLEDGGVWPGVDASGTVVPLGLILGAVVAVVLLVVWARTRFGFEMRVLGDSPRAARYAGMRSKRTLFAVLCISGGVAGIGGASQIGDFSHGLDPKGLEQAAYGYAGIVVAALARYHPVAVVIVGILLGGLQNAGFALQGSDFPAGLVGVLQGTILFCALAAEVFVRYRVRWRPPAGSGAEAAA